MTFESTSLSYLPACQHKLFQYESCCVERHEVTPLGLYHHHDQTFKRERKADFGSVGKISLPRSYSEISSRKKSRLLSPKRKNKTVPLKIPKGARARGKRVLRGRFCSASNNHRLKNHRIARARATTVIRFADTFSLVKRTQRKG